MNERVCRVAVMAALLLGLHACKGKSSGAAGDGGAAASAQAGPNPLAMLNGFEGEIDIAIKDMSKNRAAPETVPIALQIKSDKVRAELPQAVASKEMPKGHIVLSTPDKKVYIVMDDQKQIVVIDLNTMGEQFKSFGAGVPKGPKEKGEAPTKPPPKVTKTGVMDKVAGLTCENWEVTEESRKMATFCVADQGASWFHLPITGIPTEHAWALELMDGKHFPLRMIGYDKKTGAEEARVELTKFEKRAVAPAIFDMPPGYKIVDISALFGKLGAGQPPGAIGAGPFAPGQLQKKHK